MRRKKFWRVLITIILVILGIGGIARFTWHLGQVFVNLVSASPSEEKIEKSTGSEILNLSEITIWTCQIGVYKEKENADQMVESLRLKGWKAGIIKEEPYTIAIGAFNSKEKAAELGSILSKEDMEVWIRQESYPALGYKVSGKNAERITVMLKIANSLLGGAERDVVKNELAGDAVFLPAGGCPSEFEELNNDINIMMNAEYLGDQSNYKYNQDLLELYLTYKSTTIKYFQ